MVNNSVALLVDLVLLFVLGRLHAGASRPIRHIDDVHSLNNPKRSEYVDHIYPIELEIKDTIETICFIQYTLIYTCKLKVKAC
jgi:hypothetical protein